MRRIIFFRSPEFITCPYKGWLRAATPDLVYITNCMLLHQLCPLKI